MPQLEQGDLAKVAESARRVSAEMAAWIDKGYDIVALVPSCALMLKFEWPLILPGDESVKRLAQSTFDISEYVVSIAKKEGLAEGLGPLPGGVALHMACHARAQNMGQKAAEMLRLLPEAEVAVIELKVGRPVARQAAESGKTYIVSECPLAGEHIVQGIARLGCEDLPEIEHASHPIELFARAYGITL
jgi:glycerol-3-phosphate dehydrogenase subunit C